VNTPRRYRPPAQVRAVGGPYVDQVVADFNTLPDTLADNPRYQAARELVERRGELDWQQLFTLELWVLELMPLHQLEVRAAGLEQVFAHVPIRRPVPSDTDYVARLQGWAVNMQSERQWVFRKNLLREQEAWRLRRRLHQVLAAVTVLALAVGWVGNLLAIVGSSVIAATAWFGVAGGYASVARRAQPPSVTRPGDSEHITALGDLCALDVGQDSVVQGMLLGGLFAVVGLFILASGLIQLVVNPGIASAVLPHFGGGAETGEWGYLGWLSPATPMDFARLVVWSFLFGFAERLVPDVLDKLSGKLNFAGRRRGDPSRKPR